VFMSRLTSLKAQKNAKTAEKFKIAKIGVHVALYVFAVGMLTLFAIKAIVALDLWPLTT